MFAILGAVLVLSTSCFTQEVNIKCNENEVFMNSGVECNCNKGCYLKSSPSCLCPEGFARNVDQDCIPLTACDNEPIKRCDHNQILVQCVNACQPTCEDPDLYPCPDEPCVPGCVCKGDFVLKGNGSENVCVPKTQCPTKTTTVRPPLADDSLCGVNAEFVVDKPECICGEHCYVPRSVSCICKEGFIKHNGTCISNAECLKIQDADPECGPNEEQVPCEDPCPKTCGNLDREPCFSYQCTLGCRCKPDTMFDEIARDCVPIGTCKKPETEGNPEEGDHTDAPCSETHEDRAHLTNAHKNLFRLHGTRHNTHTNKNHQTKQHNTKHHNTKHHQTKHHQSKQHHTKHHETKNHQKKNHRAKHHNENKAHKNNQ